MVSKPLAHRQPSFGLAKPNHHLFQHCQPSIGTFTTSHHLNIANSHFSNIRVFHSSILLLSTPIDRFLKELPNTKRITWKQHHMCLTHYPKKLPQTSHCPTCMSVGKHYKLGLEVIFSNKGCVM